jgi:linoleoyl-CoA desaturase
MGGVRHEWTNGSARANASRSGPDADDNRIKGARQASETLAVDFARHSRLLCWLLGGLNFEVEHHLCPRICHVHYPALSEIVEEVGREFGVRYVTHASLWAGIKSHFRWLKRMGTGAVA